MTPESLAVVLSGSLGAQAVVLVGDQAAIRADFVVAPGEIRVNFDDS